MCVCECTKPKHTIIYRHTYINYHTYCHYIIVCIDTHRTRILLSISTIRLQIARAYSTGSIPLLLLPVLLPLLLLLVPAVLGTEVLTRLGDDVLLKCDNDRGQKVSWVKDDFQIVSYRGIIDTTEYPR